MDPTIPLPRTKHHVTIEFDIDVAPQLAKKIQDAIGSQMHGLLGYPQFALNVDYSFNNPKPPAQVKVTVVET
jgi:hypothetical protein